MKLMTATALAAVMAVSTASADDFFPWGDDSNSSSWGTGDGSGYGQGSGRGSGSGEFDLRMKGKADTDWRGDAHMTGDTVYSGNYYQHPYYGGYGSPYGGYGSPYGRGYGAPSYGGGYYGAPQRPTPPAAPGARTAPQTGGAQTGDCKP